MRRRILFVASMLLLICSAMAEPSGVAPTIIGGVYQVATWDNLLWISQDEERWDNDYVQIADINFPADMNTWNEGAGWAPIGIHYNDDDYYENPPDIPFTGTYNGQNFSINNLYINRPTGAPGYEPVGLFGFIDLGATLENIRLTNISVLGGERNVGALIGYNNLGNIINCHVIGAGEPAKSGEGVSESWGVVALIVTDKNNKNGYEVEAGYNLGGLAGRNKGLIDGSSSSVKVRGGGHAGGLVGVNQGIVRNSNASGSVRDQDINSWVYGGLVGRNTGSIENSYAAGTVTGGGHIGGLVGQNFGDITLCYATGEVVQINLQYGTTGGLVGRNAYEPFSNNQGLGTINLSHATGNVSGAENTGGLVGRNENTINESHATGHVIGTRNVGGLVGNNKGTIENTYAWGKVSVTSDTNNENYGGLVGRNGESEKKSSITIINSYSTGEVPLSSSGATNIGGLVGNNEGGAITDCFWNTDTAGEAGVGYEDDGGAEGKDTDEMQDIATFSYIWNISPRPDIEKNYPVLNYEMNENGTKDSGVWIIGTATETGPGEPVAVPVSNFALYLSILLIGLFSLYKWHLVMRV